MQIVGDAAQQAGVRADAFERVPADVGGLQLRVIIYRGEALTHAGEGGEAGSLRRFGRSGEEPLQADADSEEPSAAGDAIAHGAGEVEIGEELSRLEVAHAGQHDLRGGAHDLGRLGHDYLVRAKVVERLHHAGQIARFVVDHCDH